MAKLILSMDGLVLKDIPLTKERMSIGRKSHNDIQIDNLAINVACVEGLAVDLPLIDGLAVDVVRDRCASR